MTATQDMNQFLVSKISESEWNMLKKPKHLDHSSKQIHLSQLIFCLII